MHKPTWHTENFIHAIDVFNANQTWNGPTPPRIFVEAKAKYRGVTTTLNNAILSRPVFFVIDVDFESAYVHWQSECAVYLREWESIHRTYPHAKIVIGSKIWC